MGADIHAVLQTKMDGEWDTIVKDVFPDRNYDLFGFLSGVRGEPGADGPVAHEGLPEGFIIDDEGNHEGFWMGEHSFGHFTAEEFCDATISEEAEHQPSIHFESSAFTTVITIERDAEEWDDGFAQIRSLQTALRMLLGSPLSTEDFDFVSTREYRFVIGYDS